ncbi:MAG TPA: glutamate--tRNA ligase, partial [Candidatus Paceibacterota bacterium]|nr:glutamate--tRNA ligase [Candidatus Paceibacterota bacterium]
IELLQSREPFTAESVKEVIFPYATEVGRAEVLWPMRVALSGREKSPDPFTLAGLLGREKTLKRLNKALSALE